MESHTNSLSGAQRRLSNAISYRPWSAAAQLPKHVPFEFLVQRSYQNLLQRRASSQQWHPPPRPSASPRPSSSSAAWTHPSPPRCASASASSTCSRRTSPSRPPSPPLRPSPAPLAPPSSGQSAPSAWTHGSWTPSPPSACVVSTATGVDHIDLHECARRGVVVANSGNVYSTDVADHAVGMLIDVLRRVSAAERFIRRGLWPMQGDYPFGSKLGGKRVGIVGLGNIGSLISKRLEAFGCVIYYNSRRPKDSVSYKYFPNVLDLASESDVLIVACALNDETRHIVNKEVLEALGKDGVVINVGRGANIDEVELVHALQQGKIAGAGLDVFENEPKVPAQLLALDNVVLTPHVVVFTSESWSDIRDHTIRNLEAFFLGKPLLTPVLP